MFFFTVFFQPGRMSGEKKKTNLFPSLFLPLRTPLSQDTGEILGVHIIGPRATELLAAAGVMLSHEATVQSVQNTVFAHPTLSEVMGEAAHAVYGMAIHY